MPDFLAENTFLVPAALVFVAVAFGTIAVVLLIETAIAAHRRREVLRRLRPEAEGGDRLGGLIRENEDMSSALERAVARIPRLRDAKFLIAQAGVAWSVPTFVLLTVGCAAAFGLAAMTLSQSLIVGAATAAVAALMPDAWLRLRRRRRLRRFEEQLPDAIDLLGRAIRAGHPLSAGIRMVADETQAPVATEFRTVFEEQRFGLPFENALLGLADRNDLVDVRILVTAVLVQREVGGNLAEILDKIATTIRARFTIRRQLRVYTAQGRMTGYILACMPIVMAGLIFLLEPDYASMLRTERLGRYMVVTAAVMQGIGFLWIRRIIDIEI